MYSNAVSSLTGRIHIKLVHNLLLGLAGIVVLGIAAERSGEPAFNFLAFGGLLFVGGLLLWAKLRRQPRQNTRFSMFRKRDQPDEQGDEEDDRGWGDPYEF